MTRMNEVDLYFPFGMGKDWAIRSSLSAVRYKTENLGHGGYSILLLYLDQKGLLTFGFHLI